MRDKELAFDEGLIEAEEDFVIDAQFLIQELLEERKMTRAELARRVGISKARLTQLLRSDANPTLRTIARVLFALGEKPRLKRCSEQAMPETPASNCWVESDLQGGRQTREEAGYDSVLAFKALFDQSERFVENHRAQLFDVVEPANDCNLDDTLEVAA